MKTIVANFRTLALHNKVLCFVYALALITVAWAVTSGPAHAQSGNIYALPQAQSIGNVYEAVVVQVSVKEVEANMPVRAAGAGLGSAAGLVLASTANPQHRMAANTVGMLLGGLFGERTANAVMTTVAQEIIVQLAVPGGVPRTVVIVQPAPFDKVFPQEAVYVSEVRGTYRILKRSL